MQRMDERELQDRVAQLPGWTTDGHTLRKEFRFENFVQAFGWMTSVALCAERLNHHPDWKNVYNRVWVELSTHDASGITSLDFQLAQQMDGLYSARK